MNKQFLQACASFVKPQTLSHQQEVTRLYRAALRSTFSWTGNRQLFLEEAMKLRTEFRKNSTLKADSKEANDLVKKGQQKLLDYYHPEKYVLPWMPGGSLFMRNAPPPLELCYPHGIPEDVAHSIVPVHPDQIPVTFRPSDEPILVDFQSRTMI